MTVVECHQSGLFLKSRSNSAIVLFAQIYLIRSFTISTLRFFVLSPSFFVSFRVCLGHSKKLGSQKIAAASGIASTIHTVLAFNSSCVKGSTSKPVPSALQIVLGGMLSVNGRSLVTCRVT